MPAQDEQGGRLALIVASSKYRDPTLKQLRAPGHDACDLAKVLRDPAIGMFEVRTLIDTPTDQLTRDIARFFNRAGPSDLLLVYLSCHGVLDDRGRLYYATIDTECDLLSATAVAAQWLTDQIDDSRARRKILLLDCCHSGAFAKGRKGDSALALRDRFSGRGNIVLTASRATEYSFEGANVVGEGVLSVFTRAVVDGLRTGQADRDKDGRVTVDDLYHHVYETLRAAEPPQTPELWAFGAEGDLLVARSPRGPVVEPAPLPEDLRLTLENPHLVIRESGVKVLADLLDHGEPGLALTARQELQRISEQDQPRIAALAQAALDADHGQAVKYLQNLEQARQKAGKQGPPQPERRKKVWKVWAPIAAAVVAAGLIAALIICIPGPPKTVSVYSGDSYGFSDPCRIAVDGAHVWVTNYGSDSVTELNASDGSWVQTLAAANYGFSAPGGIAVDGTHVWIGNSDGDSVTELNASDGSWVQTLSGGSYRFNDPHAIAAGGPDVWVANNNSNSVTELNASDGSWVRTLSGGSYRFNQPSAIAVYSTHVWVTNSHGDSVTELNADDGSWVRTLSGDNYRFNHPEGIAVDGTHVWVTNSDGDSVTELNASDGSWVQTLSGGSYRFNDPYKIAVDSTHIWVTNNLGYSVTELNASGGSWVQTLSGDNYGFNAPQGIAVDGSHLWVANYAGNSVTELPAG